MSRKDRFFLAVIIAWVGLVAGMWLERSEDPCAQPLPPWSSADAR